MTGVQVTQVSNGVRIEFSFDGTFNFKSSFIPEWGEFNDAGDWPPTLKSVRTIHFWFTNARSQAGSFFDVSRYPVSHVEISIPPGAPEGVGLEANVVLEQPARALDVEVGNDEDWCCYDPPPLPSFDIRSSEDNRRLIVTVLSDRLPEQPEVRRTAEQAGALPQELAIQNNAGVLSVRAQNAPIGAFAQALSEASGSLITVDDALTRFIQMNLPATTLPETLGLLQRAYDVALYPMGDALWITDGSPQSGARFPALETGYVPLRYVRSTEAADLFPDFLRRFLRPDESGNGLVVMGNAALVEKVRADAAKIDQPPPEIEVQVVAAEISDTNELQAGLQLDTQQKSYQVHLDAGAGNLFFDRIDSANVEWQATLNALVSSGHARIIAQPKARVQSGNTATLFVGAQNLLPVLVGDFRQDETLITVEAGTSLEVTPWTGSNGEITMKLKPKVSEIVRGDNGGDRFLLTLDTRSAMTTLRAHTGDTMVIGGLRERSQLVNRRRIPILGSLPFIGGLFRQKGKSRLQDDLVLFVTARTVEPSGEATPSPALPRRGEG